MDTISNLVFDIKEKITDAEFKDIMETLQEFKIREDLQLYKIFYLIPTAERDYENPKDIDLGIKFKTGYAKLDSDTVNLINECLEENGKFQEDLGRLNEYLGNEGSMEAIKEIVFEDDSECCNHSDYFHIRTHISTATITKIVKIA